MRTAFFIALASSFLAAGCGRSPQKEYIFALPSGHDLHDNAAITYRGVKVGALANIRLDSSVPSGVVATGLLADPQMRLFAGDTARVISVSLLGNPEIEILRGSEVGPELQAGSTITVVLPPNPVTILTNISSLASEFTQLPADKQVEVMQQIRGIIRAAKTNNAKDAPTNRP